MSKNLVQSFIVMQTDVVVNVAAVVRGQYSFMLVFTLL